MKNSVRGTYTKPVEALLPKTNDAEKKMIACKDCGSEKQTLASQGEKRYVYLCTCGKFSKVPASTPDGAGAQWRIENTDTQTLNRVQHRSTYSHKPTERKARA